MTTEDGAKDELRRVAGSPFSAVMVCTAFGAAWPAAA